MVDANKESRRFVIEAATGSSISCIFSSTNNPVTVFGADFYISNLLWSVEEVKCVQPPVDSMERSAADGQRKSICAQPTSKQTYCKGVCSGWKKMSSAFVIQQRGEANFGRLSFCTACHKIEPADWEPFLSSRPMYILTSAFGDFSFLLIIVKSIVSL